MPAIREPEYVKFLLTYFKKIGHGEWVRLSMIYTAAGAYFSNKLKVKNGGGIKMHGMHGAIRRTLQHHCSARPHYKPGAPDLFLNKHGWWALR